MVCVDCIIVPQRVSENLGADKLLTQTIEDYLAACADELAISELRFYAIKLARIVLGIYLDVRLRTLKDLLS